jgi:hypothetical protein
MREAHVRKNGAQGELRRGREETQLSRKCPSRNLRADHQKI